jgi:hypothetical protein
VFVTQNVRTPASESTPSIATAGEQVGGRRFLGEKMKTEKIKEIRRLLTPKIKMI